MKKVVFLLLLTGLTFSGYSSQVSDTMKKPTAPSPQKVEVTVKTADGVAKTPAPCPDCCPSDQGISTRALVWMPVILFIVVLFVVWWTTRRSGYRFTQALYENDPEEIVVPAPTDTDPNATLKKTVLDANGQPVYQPSTSRLIALLSALTTLIIVVCFISYYAYCMIRCKELPDFEELFNVVLALGLGVVPYSVNKVTAAASK